MSVGKIVLLPLQVGTSQEEERPLHQPQLRPLFFEVPLEEGQVFVPRNWIFSSMLNSLSESLYTRGVILFGAPGTGKFKT